MEDDNPFTQDEGKQPPRTTGEPGSDSKNMGMLCHLLSLTGLVTGGLGAFLAPLILWLVKKDDDPFIDACGKEAVNFNLAVLIASFVLGVLVVVSTFLTVILIGFLLLPLAGLAIAALWIYWFVFTIIAAIDCSKGTVYRYPLTLRFIK